MRRTIGVGLSALLLALSAGGEASGWGGIDPEGTNVFKGDVEGGGKFYFEARYKHGEPIKMGYVLALSVPVECAEGNAKASFVNEALPLRIKVRKRAFALDAGEIQKAEPGVVSEQHPFVGELTGKLDKDGRHASWDARLRIGRPQR